MTAPPMDSDQQMTRYCLKAMVLARLFAEATVLIAFMSAPIVLLCTGKMQKLDLPVQGLFYCLAVIGLAILPWFGFLTWQVRVDENGLTADALFRHQFCAWETMKKITRRATWNWQRYVIEFEGGSLHFPVLLARSGELIQTIREHLPSGESAYRMKVQIGPSLTIQFQESVKWCSQSWHVFSCRSSGTSLRSIGTNTFTRRRMQQSCWFSAC